MVGDIVREGRWTREVIDRFPLINPYGQKVEMIRYETKNGSRLTSGLAWWKMAHKDAIVIHRAPPFSPPTPPSAPAPRELDSPGSGEVSE